MKRWQEQPHAYIKKEKRDAISVKGVVYVNMGKGKRDASSVEGLVFVYTWKIEATVQGVQRDEAYVNMGKRKERCKQCGGTSFCMHGKSKRWCKECKGTGLMSPLSTEA